MKINRTKNAARNMVMGFINKIIVLLLPFLVRTAFIYSLGAEYLGLNSLFSSILSVLSVAELGFSTNNILNARIVDKKFPQLRCKGKITSEDKKEIKKQVSGLMVSKICFMTRNSFDSIFVSAFISLTMTTVYNNYYYIVNAIVGVMNVITSAMIGGIGNSIAAESKKKNYNDFTVFNFIYMWISNSVFCSRKIRNLGFRYRNNDFCRNLYWSTLYT